MLQTTNGAMAPAAKAEVVRKSLDLTVMPVRFRPRAPSTAALPVQVRRFIGDHPRPQRPCAADAAGQA
ncbi:hypothetical protein AB3X09_12905 [Xanthomonas tesorieronis]|uniref:hypothetical protein n=1 Tax=Xanthomonas tesorieronis TaxID=3160839 RepID=UPI0035184C5C